MPDCFNNDLPPPPPPAVAVQSNNEFGFSQSVARLPSARLVRGALVAFLRVCFFCLHSCHVCFSVDFNQLEVIRN